MGRTIFSGANLFDGERPTRPDVNVVVDGERVVEVVPGGAPEARPGDRVVELAGRTLMPGMASCHFHSTFGGPLQRPSPMLGLEHPVPTLTLIGADNLATALACGITATVGSSVGDGIDVSLKEAVEAGLIRGPRMLAGSRALITSGSVADGNNQFWYYGLANSGSIRHCDGPDAFRRAVREERGRGADFVKLYLSDGHGAAATSGTMSLTPEELRAAVDEAHERGGRVRVHAVSKRSILEAARAGVDVIDHADRVDAECIEAMVAAGTTVVPSLFYSHRLLEFLENVDPETLPFGGGTNESPEARAVRVRGVREEFEYTRRMLPELVSAGLNVVLGDDFGTFVLPHGDYGQELEFYVKQLGVSALEVLRWATRNGGRLVDPGGALGTIEPGSLADLLVVDGDPTTDVRCLTDAERLKAIVKGGAFVKDAL
jgi:imidazolonepropionase-like amidohydrolase